METRRRFLGKVALGLGVAVCQSAVARPAEGAAYVGVETSASNNLSRASFFSASGERVASVPLDFRAHGCATRGSTVVVFPRRPGNVFALLGRESLQIFGRVTAPPNRRFNGHGAFTVDGQHLLVTENDLETLSGGIGVYEIAHPIRRLGHIDLPGPGPHEIIRTAQKDRFFIALGGLETHPDYGRTPLNLSTFRSQILTFDFDSSAVEPLGHWSGTEGISLRHLAEDGRGSLYVGGQIADARRATSQSIVWVAQGGKVESVPSTSHLMGYVSSVAAHGQTALVTSNEASVVMRLSGAQMIDRWQLDGASAIAMSQTISAVSGYASLSINDSRIDVTPIYEFDNHGLAL